MPIITRFLMLVIRGYQLLLSPFLGINCRFTPSCSCYATQAISTHGAGKGILLTFRRLLRCHPFAKAGFDQVPPAETDNINSPNKV